MCVLLSSSGEKGVGAFFLTLLEHFPLGAFQGQCNAIPIKCFVSHRPPSREGGSVGRAKKRSEHKKGSECQ